MAQAKLACLIVLTVLSCQLKLSGTFTMGTHNNPSFPTTIETHRTITKCALDRSAHAFLRTKNPELDEPGPCGTDGIWSDLVRATSRLSIGISEYKKVRDLIWQSSVDVDAKYDSVSRYHFDGETLEAANDMIITNTRTSRDLLRVGQLTESRKLVGEMLHTTQDFYSHSNWVELGNTAPLDTLGVARELGTLAAKDEPTCMRCIATEVGYCYDNIDYDILDNKKLMSGYYTKQDSVKPPGVTKCSHGGYLDSGDLDGGINKDAINEPEKLQLSPHGYLHFEAANLAIESSVRFLSNFWDMVGYENYGKFLAFDQRSSTIVITIDTTGSMAEEINACLQAATQLALTFSDSASQPAYVLSPFNDPGYGPATYYENVTHFVNDISKLRASGGGDAPEMCMHGILLGANEVRQPGGMMFVFTDALAKDAALENDVISLLKEKQLIVNFVITGSIDLAQYKRIASATGGQVLMVLDQRMIVEATLSLFNATFVNLVADPTAEMVEMLYAKSEVAVTNTPTYDVDADSSLKQVSIVVATDSAVFPKINITADRVAKHLSELSLPSRTSSEAREAVPIDYTVTYSDSTKSIVEVRSVPSATLQIRSTFSGVSKYSMSVTAAATFNVALRFMRETPIGFSPVLSGEPLVGQPIWAYVEVDSADYVVQQLVLLDENSVTLLTLPAVTLASDPLSFAAQFTVPPQSFRVRVQGINKATGDSFVRLVRSQFTASSAYLQLLETESSFVLYPSSTKQVQLRLTNVATDRTYALSVTGTAALLMHRITPSSVTLSLNQTVVANITVIVPASNVIGTVDTITVVAKATSGGTDANSMIITAVVADPVRDVTAPQMLVVSANPEVCSTTTVSLCNTVTWSAVVSSQDDGGLQQFYVRDATSTNLADLGVSVEYTPALTIGTTQPITASMTAPCCVGYLAFVSVDIAGNLGQATFRAETAKDLLSTTAELPSEATTAEDLPSTAIVSTAEETKDWVTEEETPATTESFSGATTALDDEETTRFATEATATSAKEVTTRLATEATATSAKEVTTRLATEATATSAKEVTTRLATEATATSAKEVTTRLATEATATSANEATTRFSTAATSNETAETTTKAPTTVVLSTVTSEATIEFTTVFSTAAATVTTTKATSAATSVTSRAPPSQFVILVVNSALTIDEIEAQLEAQFATLFEEYCAGPSADVTCKEYTTSFLRFRKKSTGCTYDVSIFNSTAQSNVKTLYTAVYYVCNGAASPMPSALLASFFNATSNNFDQILIVAVYTAPDMTLSSTEAGMKSTTASSASSSSSTSTAGRSSSWSPSSSNAPVQTSVYYIYLNNETYEIVIICLSVVAFLLLVSVVGILVYYNTKTSLKKHGKAGLMCCNDSSVAPSPSGAESNGKNEIPLEEKSNGNHNGNPSNDYA